MRTKILTTTLVLVPVFGACSPASSYSDLDLCKITYNKYPDFRDDPALGKEYGELFTQDGVFSIGDTATQGREAIVERHKSAHTSAVWVHKLNKPVFNIENGIIFAKGDVVVSTGPDKDNLNTRIEASYSDEFEVVGGVCRIKVRKTTVTKSTQKNETKR